MKKQHNGVISIWKFIFAVCIYLHHCSSFAGKDDFVILSNMAIGVVFFFIVSGYLFAKSALAKKESQKSSIISDTWSYLFGKIKKLLPYVIIGATAFLITMIIVSSQNIYFWIESLWNYTLLQMSGVGVINLNAPMWYISAMLFVFLIVYPFLRKYKEKYSQLVAPILVIIFGGILFHNYSDLHSWSVWLGLCYKGTLTAFLSIHVGIVVYEICEKIKNINFTFFGRFLLTITEIGLFNLIILCQNFLAKAPRLDYFWLVFFAIAILIAFSEKTLTYSFCCNKLFYYLERLSLPIYLNQAAVIKFITGVSFFAKYSYYQKIAIGGIFLLVLSILTLKVVELWDKYKGKLGNFCKKILIVSHS